MGQFISQSHAACGFLLLADKRRVGQVRPGGVPGENAHVIVILKEFTIVIQFPAALSLPHDIAATLRLVAGVVVRCWWIHAFLAAVKFAYSLME
jgi:hypothetical protein